MDVVIVALSITLWTLQASTQSRGTPARAGGRHQWRPPSRNAGRVSGALDEPLVENRFGVGQSDAGFVASEVSQPPCPVRRDQ